MATQELEREQQKLIPKDDLRPYAGRWVALRDGHVIATDVDADRLRANPEVTSEDVLLPVPPLESAYYIL